jgi:hypothetical protein
VRSAYELPIFLLVSLPNSPEEVLLAALRALDEHDHARITALTDPESLRKHFEGYCDVSQPMTLERFAKQRAMAPEQAAEMYDRWLKSGGSIYPIYQFRGLGVSTHAELVALGPEEYFTRSMAGADPASDLARLLREHGRAVPPELLAPMPGVEYVVLGGVYETPELVHLLFRYVFHRGQPGEYHGSVTRVALRRQTDGAWRLVVEGYHFLDAFWPQRVVYIDEQYADLVDELREEQLREGKGKAPPPA